MVIQCQQFRQLKASIEKISILYIAEKIAWKSFVNLQESMQKIIIYFEKKKMLLITKEELESHQDARNYYVCGKRS